MVVDHFPDEDSVVQATEQFVCLGGGVAVATAVASSLGCHTVLADRLGTDQESNQIVSTLSAADVNTNCLQRSPESTASGASVWVNKSSGSRTIVFSPGLAIDLQWSQSIEDFIKQSKILHLNGRHPDVSLRAIELAKRSGTLVSFDGGAHRYRPEVLPMVGQADVLIVAEHFARTHASATGFGSAKDASLSAAQLCEMLLEDFSAQVIGVTCGAEGSWFLINGEKPWHQPACHDYRVLDTTGCGDTFHGAFLSGLAEGKSPQQCATLASRVAAWQAARPGAFSLDLKLHADELIGDD